MDLLFRSIAKCGTDLQNQIEKVSVWFTITEGKVIMDYTFAELLETCVEINHTMYPHTGIQIDHDIDSPILFRGSTFTHFVDILTNCFDNVVEYSDDLKVRINIVQESNKLSISFTNTILESLLEDMETYENKIKDIKSKLLNDNNNRHSREGGSGFLKIQKLLKYDLNIQDCLISIQYIGNMFETNISIDTERIILK